MSSSTPDHLVTSASQSERTTLYFGGSRKVVNTSVDSALRGARAFRKEGGWSAAARSAGLLVDLSKVTWCEVSACVRLVLVIERALRDGIQVEVALPNPNVLVNEKRWLEEEERHSRAERRKRVLRFLQKIEFRKAVSCPHLDSPDGQLITIEHYDRSDLDTEKSQWIQENGAELEEERYRHQRIVHVLPLRWISAADRALEEIQGDLSTIKDAVAKLVGHESRGILNFDAEAFANVVFHELLSNVEEHAGVDHCLIGIWARRAGQFFLESEHPEPERSFFRDWVEPNRFPLIDVAFGDSGRGIQTVLKHAYESEPLPREGVPEFLKKKEEGIVFWSLGRWSTSRGHEEKRGTRGLHRVHRLVKGYNGQVTLRAGTVLAGWNHGGNDFRQPIAARGLPNCPGTFVAVRLTARVQLSGVRVSPPIQPHNVDFVIGPSIRVAPEGLPTDIEDSLRRALSTGRVMEHRCVIVPLASAPDNLEDLKKGFERALEQLRDLSNPGALVLLVPELPPEQLDTYVDSASEVLTRENRSIHARVDSIEVTNPFLVVDRTGKIHWSGMLKPELAVLERLEELAGKPLPRAELEELLPEPDWRAAFWVDLKQHDDLFSALKEGPALRFTVGDVFDFIHEKVSARLDDIVNDPLQVGILQGPLMSPSLCIVKKWLKCSEVLENFGWFQISPEVLKNLTVTRQLPKGAIDALVEQAGHYWYTSRGVLDTLGDTVSGRKHDHTQRILRRLLHIRGSHLPMLALGIAVRNRLGEIEAPDFVVYDDRSATALARGLNAWLGIPREPISLPALIPPGNLREVWEVIEDRKVLVYCDVILTANSLRQILGRITKSAGRTVAIACLYDQRPDDQNGKPLREAGETVPVVSLAATPETTVVDRRPVGIIDARTGRLTDPSADQKGLEYPISEDQWLDFSQQEGALFFNHFLVPEERHSIFHLDPQRLFKSADCVEATIEALSAQQEIFYNRHGLAGDSAAKILVRVNDEFPDSLMSEVVRRLKLEEIEKARRLEAAPSFVSIPAGIYQKHAVVLLWSASSGATASRLAYELATAGAKSVLVLVWASRMRTEQEEVLRAIDSLLVAMPTRRQAALTGGGFAHSREPRQVPIQIAFLSSVTLPFFAEHACPVCAFRRRFRGEFRGGYPSSHLREFAEGMVETFKPKKSSLSAKLEPIDCFNARLTPDECTEMVRVHKLMENSIHSTTSRLEVQERIQDIAADLDPTSVRFEQAKLGAKALFRLFSTQNELLKVPPFNFLDLRQHIADISESALRMDSHFPEELLRQAIITYRGSDKIRFARSLPELAERFVKSPVLLKQLMYDAFTYLSQDYHQNRDHLQPLNEGLEGLIEVVERGISAEASDYLPVHSIARSVYGLALRRLQQLDRGQLTTLQAWNQLSRTYHQQFRDAHQQLPAACDALFPGPIVEEYSEAVRQPIADRSYWSLTRNKWEQAQVTLEREIFPLIRILLNGEGSSLLDSVQARMFFDAGHLEFLMDVSSPRTSFAITSIGDILSKFSSRPPKATDDAWLRFRALRENFRQVLLELPKKDAKGALIFQFLQGCPCQLGVPIEKVISNAVWKSRGSIRARPMEGAQWIFCHEVVVDQLLEEALSNALVNHRIPEGKALAEIEAVATNESVQLAIRNTGSDPERRNEEGSAGRGLDKVYRMLEPYGCLLTHGAFNSSWDYEVLVTFQKGN